MTFNEPPHSFGTEDVTFAGPSGPIPVTSVVNVINPQTYEFRFACQSDAGTYHFTVGPNIFDAVGNPMAEPYVGSFAIAMPDLAPIALDIPTNGVSGTSMAVGWTVENRGSAPATGTWKDAIYLSSDAAWGGDTLLGEFSFTGPLGETLSYHRVQNVPVPALLEGDFWIIVVVDARNNVIEHQEDADNRMVSAQPVHLSLLPYPDLQVTAVSGPPSAWTGQQVTLCWTVTNAGNGSTGATLWRDDVYLSLDHQIGGGDHWLGGFENPSSLDGGGGSYEQCQTVTIPTTALGCYYFVVRTDAVNQVFEYRTDLNAEANNDGHSDPCAEVALPPPPDLRVTSVIAPAIGWSGTDISVTWEVTNEGESPTPTTYWQDSLYLSADETLGPSDILLCAVGHSGALNPTGSYDVTHSCQLPRWIEGPFYVFVLTDSGNHVPEQGWEGNNTAYDQNTVLNVNLTPPPDLEVTALTVTGPTPPDLTATVHWTVTNLGGSPTEEGYWRDAIYLSVDASFGTTADNTLVGGPYPHSGVLNPDASYDRTVNVTLPNCLDGTYYLFVVTDVDDQVEEFSPAYEDNNDDTYQELSITTDEADLAVGNVDAPTNGFSGQPITVSWEVNNIGVVDTRGVDFVDQVFLSTNGIPDPQDDFLLGSFVHEDTVTTTNGYSETRSVTLPVGVFGDYLVSVLTNATGTVVECAATANNAAYAPAGIHVEFTEADLTVSVLNVPTNGFSGQPLPIEWTVLNAGERATDASSWVDAVYLGSSSTPLAAFMHDGALGSGANYTRSEAVTMPPGLFGTHSVRVCTDVYNVVPEPGREDNNCTTATVVFSATEPDLEAYDVTAPDTGQTGTPIVVQWSVRNVGERATTESTWNDHVYCSANQTLDGSDRFLGTVIHQGVLDVGLPYTVTQTFTLASDGPGPRYILVKTDAGEVVYERGREANNVAFDPTPIEVTCNDPDLRVTTTSGPSTGDSGLPIGVTWTVTNAGDRTTPTATWFDGVYLSADPDLNPAVDALLGEFSRNAPLAVGETYTRTATVTLPNGLSGAHYLFVVTDSRDQVGECADEGNNAGDPPMVISIGLTLVDLQVVSLTASSNGYAGQETTVDWTVVNTGSSATPNNTWRDSVYLSLDPYLDPSTDPFLGYAVHTNPLGPGVTYSAGATLPIPASTPPGDYYTLVWTDSAVNVYEHNAENNNVLSSAATMQVVEPLEADLVVTDIVVPFSAAPGQTATFQWTVTNQGVNAAVGELVRFGLPLHRHGVGLERRPGSQGPP